MVNVNYYNEVKECIYKGELYSVRDNGAIKRHAREGMRLRKLDEKWTFGIPNISTGYMDYGGERVHRIVATAFHGPAPTPEHVVDHIDTNRQNNRPDNLRWVTRLENALINPITRKKIELICGSVEAFLDNPQLLWGHETEDKDFGWMRRVNKKEAQNCLENWNNWVKSVKPDPNYKKSEHQTGDWVFENPFMNKVPDGKGGYREIQFTGPAIVEPEIKQSKEKLIEERKPLRIQSLTPNAIQINWKYRVAFPCCPQQFSGNPLEAYMNNLEKGKVFSTNKNGDSTIIRFNKTRSDSLWVMCSISIGWKTHAITKISFVNGVYDHENMGVYDIGDEPDDIFDTFISGDEQQMI